MWTLFILSTYPLHEGGPDEIPMNIFHREMREATQEVVGSGGGGSR